MKTGRVVLALVLVCLVLTSTALFAEKGSERRPPREKWELISIGATIEAIDLESREVILRGPMGNLFSVVADDRVERLDEFKVGDIIHAEYWTYLKAEFRNPTPAEKDEPLVVLVEGAKAPEGWDPSVEIGAVVQAVVTIEIINRPDMIVTVKGPGGNYVSIPVEDSKLLEKLRIGEVVVLTYAEALALTLEKVD
jgi:hypothetical protein